jgi:hypothetical protein
MPRTMPLAPRSAQDWPPSIDHVSEIVPGSGVASGGPASGKPVVSSQLAESAAPASATAATTREWRTMAAAYYGARYDDSRALGSSGLRISMKWHGCLVGDASYGAVPVSA